MCHLVLLLPLVGLTVFWLWPLGTAVPVYGIILAVSLVTYRALLTAMRRPAVTGPEGLRHAVGEVMGRSERGWSVRLHGELWRATSSDPLKPHDEVEVIETHGLTLRVRKIETSQR